MASPKVDPKAMTPDQKECYKLLCDLLRGAHHIDGIVRTSGSNGLEVNLLWSDFATFDNSLMTRLVFMAHDRCIRASLRPGSPDRIKLGLWKREPETKGMTVSQRHPTLGKALQDYREFYPLSDYFDSKTGAPK